ncbi:NAD-dependent dehydratase [Candidatus Woesebacteria bacterium]|nr:NAD-dependent dehydratase [Candidatus Woesebacteria bacterium]
MKQTLVAGGAGFVGSHLCENLINHGWKVLCVDNLITGSLENIQTLRKNKNFSFVKADISKPISGILKMGKYSLVFHLASPASPVKYTQYPIETILANTQGTQNLLELCRKKKAAFLFASTSEIYGNPEIHPQPETYWGNVNPIGPRSCYDESKRLGETFTMLYHKKYGVDARIIRIFNTYGPRMQNEDGRVIPNFINQALSGADITVYGRGSQTRAFCYVSDLVEGIRRAATRRGTNGVVFNLGNPKEFTILELVKIVKELTQGESKVVHKALPQDDPVRRKPIIRKAKSVLNWEPKISLRGGLVPTIDYFARQLQ